MHVVVFLRSCKYGETYSEHLNCDGNKIVMVYELDNIQNCMEKCSYTMKDTVKHLKNIILSFNGGAELRSFPVPLRVAQSASLKGGYNPLDICLLYTIREYFGSSAKMTPPRYRQISDMPANLMADRTRISELTCLYPLILLTMWCQLTSKPLRPRLLSVSRSSTDIIFEAINIANHSPSLYRTHCSPDRATCDPQHHHEPWHSRPHFPPYRRVGKRNSPSPRKPVGNSANAAD